MGRELHVHTHPSQPEIWRHGAEIAALVIAALWAFYVFIYQERIKPATALPEGQPTVTVHHELLSRSKEFVKVDFAIKNIGQAPFRLTGLIVNVYGIKFLDRSGDRVLVPIPGVFERSKALLATRPTLLYSFYDTWSGLGATKKFGALLSGQEFTESFVFGIKPSSYDVAKAVWVFCWSRPGDQKWNVKRMTRADGSYWFDNTNYSGLYCDHQRRGAYYPL